MIRKAEAKVKAEKTLPLNLNSLNLSRFSVWYLLFILNNKGRFYVKH